jgi:hypothetical protein
LKQVLLRILLGSAIGALFVWLSVRGASDAWGRLAGDVRLEGWVIRVGDARGWQVDLSWVLVFLGVLGVVHVLRVVRYVPLLDPLVKLDLATHNRIGAVGFMAMFLFPLRLGELARPFLVKQTVAGRVRMTRVLSTVVVERVVDGLVVSLLLASILGGLPSQGRVVDQRLTVGAWVALGVFVGASLLLAGAVWQHDRTVGLLRATFGRVAPGLIRRVIELVDTFVGGLRSLPSGAAFGRFLGLTVIYWGVNGLGIWSMTHAFGLPVDLVGAYAMMACVVVGMMVPNSPGNIGSFWYFLLIPLPLYGVSEESTPAIAFGLAVWLCQLVQQTAFAGWFLLRGQVSLKGVLGGARAFDEPTDAQDARAAA